jgi:hypothetical protein
MHLVLGMALASGSQQRRLADSRDALQRHGIVT